MEYILNSDDHKVTNNCLRFNFKKAIRFIDQKISLMSIKCYNYFENLSNEFSKSIKYKYNKLIVMTFEMVVITYMILTKSLMILFKKNLI